MEPFLTPEDIAELKTQHRKCKDKRHAYRLNCILLLNRGMSLKEISDLLLLDEDTIQRYYNIWEEEGISGLLTDHYRGGSPKLSIVQQESLKKHLISVTYQRASEICDYVRKNYGVKYSVEGMTFLLHRLGFSYKMYYS